MELPLGGPALRHYTQSRPRPHRQKLNYRPSRPQETIIESENEVLEHMGRVDEGVEEFFTKRVLPADPLKKQDEESITVHEQAPASSAPCPPPTKTLRRKLGDFFTLKKRRGLKSETSHEGRPKKASIADLIRPLREVARAEKEKDRDRAKENDKENEKEKTKEPPSAEPAEPAAQETPVSGGPALRGETVPPRRALREGKSQSLILLSGSAAAGATNARNTSKKQFEGQHSFEQKLHLMLQRIGVSKPQPAETQNQEGEMKKAESEGTIIDSKPEPPPTFSKPRTMSASSDTRHQIRPSLSAHEAAGKPALLPKPVIKPGPPPAASGRNTPENELAQIQEGEPNAPAADAPAVPTIPSSVPDSTSSTSSPSSTVTPADADACTDSVGPPAAATTPTDVTKIDSEASVPETRAATAALPASALPATPASAAAPAEPTAPVPVSPSSSESITQSLSVTSSSTTITMPSISTSESSVSTASTKLSTKSSAPEPNGILSAEAAPAADAAPPPPTSISDMPSGLPTTASSVNEARDEPASVVSASCVTLVPPVTQTASPPSAVSPDGPVATSSSRISAALPPASSASSLPATSPTTAGCASPVSASIATQPAIPSPPAVSVPSTSSSQTSPTGTTSTTTSSNRTDTTCTASSPNTAAVSSTLSTGSDPPGTDNAGTAPTTPTISGLLATDNSSATSHHVTGPAHSNDSPGQDRDLQTSPEERSSAEKVTDAEPDVVQGGEQTKADEGEGDADGGKKSENEKATPVSNGETRKDAHEGNVKAEDDAAAEPPSGKEGEQRGNEGAVEGPKGEEAKSANEK